MKYHCNVSKICLLLFLCVCLFFTACSQNTKIELPFSAKDVASIELYHYTVPAQAQQKILTSEQEITSIIETLTTIPVKKNKSYSNQTGTTVTSFRFNLTDGTDFEIIYTCYGVKKGSIQSSYMFDYQTTSDVGGKWDNFDIPAVDVSQEILPVYDK